MSHSERCILSSSNCATAPNTDDGSSLTIPVTPSVSFVVLMLFLGSPVLPIHARLTTKLKPETVRAFDRYVKFVEASMQKRLDGQTSYLWIDHDPGNRSRLRKGVIITQRFEEGSSIPGGIIHDWVGAMFIPEVTIDGPLRVLQDIDRHQQIYPEVLESKLLERRENVIRSYLRLSKKKVLTVVLNTEHETRHFRLTDRRWHIRSYSTRIAEVKNPGKPDESELPLGEDSGFLWRLFSYWRLEEVDGGVFIELRTVSLSRNIPTGLGWMLRPIIRDMPGETLVETLQATRLAVRQ